MRQYYRFLKTLDKRKLKDEAIRRPVKTTGMACDTAKCDSRERRQKLHLYSPEACCFKLNMKDTEKPAVRSFQQMCWVEGRVCAVFPVHLRNGP